MALNLSKNQEDLARAARAVVDDFSLTNWAVFGYEGHSNTLQVTATGEGGLEEMSDNLSTGSCMYAFVRVKDPKTTLFKYVLIIWQGEGAPDTRRGICSNHIRPVTALFKGINLTLTARTEEEVEPAAILEKVSNASSSKFDFEVNNRNVSPPPAPVGSVYKKTVPSVEMSITKAREQFWQEQERDDGQRHQSEAAERQVRHDALMQGLQPINNKTPIEKVQVIVPPKPARLAQAVADSKKPNYVDLERKKWEETQKAAEKGDVNRKPSLIEQRKASFGDAAKTSQFNKPVVGKMTTASANVEGKKGFDPVASSRADEERRRFEQAQKDSETEEKERRLKAESMRQERLKEAQQLISARGSQDEPAVMANKARTAPGAKSGTSGNASGDDVALKAYREEERRKFEASQKENENDERERRLRSEASRQERLRELASLTQKKEAPVSEMFQSIGQSVKDKKQSAIKKGEDPDVVARRKEEQRRWEEAQRETQVEEQERRMRAEALRQERAQEAAALIGGRSVNAKAKSMFEQSSDSSVTTPVDTHRSSANKVAKNLFETAPIGKTVHHQSTPAAHHQHESQVPVDHHHASVRDRKLRADEDEMQKIEATRNSSHDSNEQHVAATALHDSETSDHEEHDASAALYDNSRDDFLPSPPPFSAADRSEHTDSLSESFRDNVHIKNGNGDHRDPSTDRRLELQEKAAVAAPAIAVSAWKAGLPVRPPSPNEEYADPDTDDWNDHHVPQALSPTTGSSGGSDHTGLRARALYDYQAADETEISFDPGDVITQIDKVDAGWYQGMAVNGTYGLFPANYVEMIS